MRVEYKDNKVVADYGDIISINGRACLIVFDALAGNFPVRIVALQKSDKVEVYDGYTDLESLNRVNPIVLIKADKVLITEDRKWDSETQEVTR